MSHPRAIQYSHGHQPSVLSSHATRTGATSCAYLAERVDQGARILDLGCGPGSITLDLAEWVGADGQVVGVDLSGDAIEAARRAAEQRGDQHTEFMVGDLTSLDLEPGSFDIVHAHQVLQHLPDPVGALRTMIQYCSADGIIAVRDADYGAMAWYPQEPGLEQWRQSYCAGARQCHGEPDAGRRLRAWAQQADLVIEYAGSSMWTYATTEAANWWGTSQADRVRHSSFAVRAAEQGLDPAQIEAIALAWERWGQHPDAWFFVPHGEIIARPRHAAGRAV